MTAPGTAVTLTGDQYQALRLFVAGNEPEEIAEALGLQRDHVVRVLKQFGGRDRAFAAQVVAAFEAAHPAPRPTGRTVDALLLAAATSRRPATRMLAFRLRRSVDQLARLIAAERAAADRAGLPR